MDSSLIFNIRIGDVNDHAPQFPQKEFNISVKENHAAGVCGGASSLLCSIKVFPALILKGCLILRETGYCSHPEGCRPWIPAKCLEVCKPHFVWAIK